MCKQGWLLGTWLGGLKDLKATVQEVHGYLEDEVIVPESGGRPHASPFFAFAFAFAFSACACAFKANFALALVLAFASVRVPGQLYNLGLCLHV